MYLRKHGRGSQHAIVSSQVAVFQKLNPMYRRCLAAGDADELHHSRASL